MLKSVYIKPHSSHSSPIQLLALFLLGGGKSPFSSLFLCCQGWNPVPHTCCTSSLPLNYTSSPISFLFNQALKLSYSPHHHAYLISQLWSLYLSFAFLFLPSFVLNSSITFTSISTFSKPVSVGRLRQEDLKFNANLGNLTRPKLKKELG